MRVLCFLALFAGLGFSSAAAGQPATYRLEIIPTFDEPNPETLGLAFAVNDLGEVTGIADDGALIARGFLYQDGRTSEVPGFGGMASDARHLNNFAEVAGHGLMDVGNGAVAIPLFRVPGGAARALLTDSEIFDEGISGFGWRINDAGAVAIESRGSQVVRFDGSRVAWGFGVLAGESAQIGGLNSRSQIVGTSLLPDSPGFEALIFNLDTGSAGNLNNRAVAQASFANDVNQHGAVVGEWILNSNNRTVPVIWENGVGRELPFVNEETVGWIGRAKAINDRGDILGESRRDSERLDWILFAGEAKPRALLSRVEAEFFETYDEYLAFDINNSLEVSGAAIRSDPAHPLGSTNKPALLRPVEPLAVPRPAPGLWADPARPGTGIEINREGDRFYLIWYTFNAVGQPTWYFSDTVQLTRNGWRARLLRFRRLPNGAVESIPVGTVVLSTLAAESLQFSWRLEGRAGSELYRYLAGACTDGALGLTSTWYDPESAGFGASVQQAETVSAVYYFYDEAGAARWVFLDFASVPGAADALLFTGGACPGCTPATPASRVAGNGQITIAGSNIDFLLSVNDVLISPRIAWESNNRMTRLSSVAACED